MIVGADAATDRDIVTRAAGLYGKFGPAVPIIRPSRRSRTPARYCG